MVLEQKIFIEDPYANVQNVSKIVPLILVNEDTEFQGRSTFVLEAYIIQKNYIIGIGKRRY